MLDLDQMEYLLIWWCTSEKFNFLSKHKSWVLILTNYKYIRIKKMLKVKRTVSFSIHLISVDREKKRYADCV